MSNEVLFELNGDKVMEFVCLYLKDNRKDAEDLLQKTFSKLVDAMKYNNKTLDRIAKLFLALLSIQSFEKEYSIETNGYNVIYNMPCTKYEKIVIK